MLIKDRLLKLINKKENYHESKTLASVGGGVKPSYSAAFGRCCRVEKFRSLGVETKGFQGLTTFKFAIVASFPFEGRLGWVLKKHYEMSCFSFFLQLAVLQPTSLAPLGRGLGRGAVIQNSPLLFRERTQLYLSGAQVTDAGEGLKEPIHEYPPTPSGYFSRKGGRRQRSQSASFLSPRPLGERGVMLNLFQHLTNIAYDLQSCKILNSLKIAPEITVRNYITKNDFLRFQDDKEHPSQPSLNREGVCSVVRSTLSPRGVNVWDWSVISPLLSRERTQLYLSGAKVTDAGEGSISPKRRCV